MAQPVLSTAALTSRAIHPDEGDSLMVNSNGITGVIGKPAKFVKHVRWILSSKMVCLELPEIGTLSSIATP
ncbi:MAG TPA: hypothetical protein VK458_23960, partial [Myxococcaceae bacterium]|nr:hypothetical protein [Myxococcaceae bacterium]